MPLPDHFLVPTTNSDLLFLTARHISTRRPPLQYHLFAYIPTIYLQVLKYHPFYFPVTDFRTPANYVAGNNL